MEFAWGEAYPRTDRASLIDFLDVCEYTFILTSELDLVSIQTPLTLLSMTFQQFWSILQRCGTTPKGDRFTVTPDDRLHIESPGNTNDQFFIRKSTVMRWFEQDLQAMEPREFRRRRSAYFHNVFLHIHGQD